MKFLFKLEIVFVFLLDTGSVSIPETALKSRLVEPTDKSVPITS